jgi:energy-coupling factor transporter ATP-binding protein EcfA2
VSARLSVERPFTGLRPFTYEDRAFFFGRTEQAYALYRLTTFGFIAVIGSSGSGKSSLVRAGLLPLLLENEAAKRWSVATLTPGEAPIARLADAVASLAAGDLDAADRTILRDRAEYVLRRSSSGLADAIGELPGLAEQPVMIVVDQFEEIFRYADSSAGRNAVGEARWRDESAAFVQLLLQAFRRRPSMRVLITMRSDFIGDCAEFPGLP